MRGTEFELILWDWNGTLLDDGPFSVGIINDLLTSRGLKALPVEAHRKLFDFPVIRYYERLGFDFEKEPFEVISQDFVDAYRAGVAGCNLRRGACAVLRELQEAGYRQSVLSASRQDYLEDMIRHHGLEGHFEELLGIDSVHAPGKTGRGVEWIRQSGLSPDRVLLIGDTYHDAEVAEAMGVACWLVNSGHHPVERLRASGNPVHPDLESVRDLLTRAGKDA